VSALEIVMKAPEVVRVPLDCFRAFAFGPVTGFVVGDKVGE
jgi:hypothetical protein